MRIGLRVRARIGGAALLVILAGAVVAGLAINALHARPGEWSVSLSLWRWQFDARAPTLLRWGTHPLAARVLDGRTLAAGIGRWHFARQDGGGLVATCAPCALRLEALGPEPIVVRHVQIDAHARGGDRFDGVLRLGTGPSAVLMRWGAVMSSDGLRLHAELALTPLRHVVDLFGDTVPDASSDAARARIDGRVALVVAAHIDSRGLQVDRLDPRFSDVTVSGLGTDALLDADPAARCRPQPASGRFEGWLPHAVIAAEDQRFHQHPGFEPDVWLAVWTRNARQPDAPRGASTITQQLAKILYTGDERNATRKLREWLYAVEMERTLGKARILQLYLATAPWGDGICGAEAAARHYLRKPTHLLKPHEAAWLASLLVNPEVQLRRWGQDEVVARERAVWVLRGMRRLPAWRREKELEAMATWQMRGLRNAVSQGSVGASPIAIGMQRPSVLATAAR